MKGYWPVCLIVVLLVLSAVSRGQAADSLLGYRFKRISVAEQAAVLKSPDGSLRLIRAEDVIVLTNPFSNQEQEFSVVRFDEDLAILETDGEWGRATWVVSMGDGRQQVSVMEPRPLWKTELHYTGERRE
ncbi:MAG: hypothetical protein C0614_09280 [Desulfuromonas sp.]|nr:MAG: hypothetical protein C0614_09280 [Desulfuromonas sp.]